MRAPTTSPRSALPELRSKLVALVMLLFSEQELRSWLRFNGPYDEILPFLPSSQVPFQLFVEEALSALERRGLINDTFFKRLVKARPAQSGEIIALRERWKQSLASSGEPVVAGMRWVNLAVKVGGVLLTACGAFIVIKTSCPLDGDTAAPPNSTATKGIDDPTAPKGVTRPTRGGPAPSTTNGGLSDGHETTNTDTTTTSPERPDPVVFRPPLPKSRCGLDCTKCAPSKQYCRVCGGHLSGQGATLNCGRTLGGVATATMRGGIQEDQIKFTFTEGHHPQIEVKLDVDGILETSGEGAGAVRMTQVESEKLDKRAPDGTLVRVFRNHVESNKTTINAKLSCFLVDKDSTPYTKGICLFTPTTTLVVTFPDP